MHPAYSVIFFTTASGAGYGLLFWLSLAEVFAAGELGRWTAFATLVVALALITAGLLASTFHLGHPERAIGAFSQWRSSWLSREAVAAIATYVPAGMLGLIWLFGLSGAMVSFLAAFSALGAVATVYCTGQIYATLRTIRQWNRTDVPWIYVVLSLATGALLFGLCAALRGAFGMLPVIAALLCVLVAGILKHRYWAAIDAEPGQYTAEDALGVPGISSVRPLDPPHTMPNFVMREMGYTVARKHARKLRRYTALALFVLPILSILFGLLSGWTIISILPAIVAASFGVVLERWLFFAEAEHVSQLFYGRSRL